MTPKLYGHQADAIKFLDKRGGSGALFHEMGLGKTRTALVSYGNMRMKTPGLKMLVAAPLSLLNAAWREDAKRFTGFTLRNLHDEGIPDTWDEDVWVINYESLIVQRNFMKLVSLMLKNLVMFVCDESSRMKNHASKTTKVLLLMRDRAKYRVVMSGTPAPNSEMEYWAQMEFVRPGMLHRSFFAFRNIFFHLARGKQVASLHGQYVTKDAMRQMLRSGFKYEITPHKREEFMMAIAPFCHNARKEDCLDLPDMVDEVREVVLGPRERSAYNEMKKYLITEIEGRDITAQVALTKIMKLRELTSGFAIDSSGIARASGESTKLHELDELIEEMGPKQVIVWANFRYEVENIFERLSRVAPTVTLYSGTEDRDASIRSFQSGESRYLVANPHSAAHGLTFVNCADEVFFSLDYSYEAYAQAKARIHRIGQSKKCTYTHLLASNTIDTVIMDVLQRKAESGEILRRIMESR